MQQGHRHIASSRALGGELLFCCVKSHLPEVTIKTHLSARANVFIPDSTLEVFTCSFVVSWPSLKSKVFEQMLLPDCSEVFDLEQIFNRNNTVILLPLHYIYINKLEARLFSLPA